MNEPRKPRDEILAELVSVLEENAEVLEKSVGSQSLKRQAKTLRKSIEHLKSDYFDLSFKPNDSISLGAIIELSDGREFLLSNNKIDTSPCRGTSLPIALMNVDFLKSQGCNKVGDSYTYKVGRPGEQEDVQVSIVNIR